MLSATYGSAGARSETNPKFSGREYHKNAACSSQSTRRHEVAITEQDLKELFDEQGGLCYWFGIKLDPLDIYKSHYPMAMSVDRLNNKLGYIKGNIIICCRMANLGRQSCAPEDYRKILNGIFKAQKSAPHFKEWQEYCPKEKSKKVKKVLATF
jgi:hypothetical protein